jgi:hypothetical protein
LRSLCHSFSGLKFADRPCSIGSSADGTTGGGKILFNQLCNHFIHLFSKARRPPAANGSSPIGTAGGGKNSFGMESRL